MSSLPEKFDYYQEFEFSGVEPYLLNPESVFKFYSNLEKLAAFKQQFAAGSQEKDQVLAPTVSSLEAAMIAALSLISEQHLKVNLLANVLTGIVGGAETDELKLLLSSKYQTNQQAVYSWLLTEAGVLPASSLNLDSLAVINALKQFCPQNPLCIVAELTENNLSEIVELQSNLKPEDHLFLINKGKNLEFQSILNNFIIQVFEEDNCFFSNKHNALEITQAAEEEKGLPQVVVFNQYLTQVERVKFCYFGFLKRSLEQRGLKSFNQQTAETKDFFLDLNNDLKPNSEDSALASAILLKLSDQEIKFTYPTEISFYQRLKKDFAINEASITITSSHDEIDALLLFLINSAAAKISYSEEKSSGILNIFLSSESEILTNLKLKESDAYSLLSGQDLTIITWGNGAQILDEIYPSLDCLPEIIDLKDIWPLPEAVIVESVSKTGKLLIVPDTKFKQEFSAVLFNHLFPKIYQYLDAPVTNQRKNLSEQIQVLVEY